MHSMSNEITRTATGGTVNNRQNLIPQMYHKDYPRSSFDYGMFIIAASKLCMPYQATGIDQAIYSVLQAPVVSIIYT